MANRSSFSPDNRKAQTSFLHFDLCHFLFRLKMADSFNSGDQHSIKLICWTAWFFKLKERHPDISIFLLVTHRRFAERHYYSDRKRNRGKIFFVSKNLCIKFKCLKRLFGPENRGPAITSLLMRPGGKSSSRKIRYREKYYWCLKILKILLYFSFCLLSKYGNFYGTYALRQFPVTLCPFCSFLYLHRAET